ncbi:MULTISPECIES: PA2169 family four-helix-bundle protein [unclassified Motilimonas]|uniref:PA2169 family four-helix-bundle protein n=1 Tax=Motilimonas TaxID=1914248 RepID=UPI001E38991A|nr:MULTISPECIES: PA2169 family four-helix-bundle protein [unclassified Motilimonas]MCE0558014.1 PA2169 family four-helix-bundle protein [Motilimonas sp. E26]MDO6526019.1 PA2169 family four-helix-bundle protein [Motilimonas sp. 1_MG-2023]
MSNSNYEMGPIKELVKVLNGGIEFYSAAKEKTSNGNLVRVFERNIQEKALAISDLQTFILIDDGQVETDSALSVELREAYTKIIALVSSDSDHTYISQLEEIEDKVLEKVDAALQEMLPADCKSKLLQIQVRMQNCHDEMKQLQLMTA